MSVRRGLDQPELTRVLGSNKFADRVSALARYTLETESEGGFCVYKSPATGKLTISHADLPTAEEREEWREDVNSIARIYSHLDAEGAKGSYNQTKLIWTSTRPRSDVALFVHSHPGDSSFLRPSSADLENYEDQNGRNPNIINGILVATRKRARVFLYGQTATQYARGQYQTTNPDYMDAQKARDMLADDGFCTALATFDTIQGRIVSDPSRVAEQYFSPEVS